MKEHLIAFGIYSILGAVLDHFHYYVYRTFFPETTPIKPLSNPIMTGFPLYGIGAYSVIGLNNLINDANIFIKFFVFSLVLTLYEYITGLMVGAGKTSDGITKAWDYSDYMYNYKGIISPRISIIWGILGLVLIKIHPIIIKYLRCVVKNC